MPVMSGVEQAFCRSGAWRSFSHRVVVPWAMQGHELVGEVLELGSGSGAMAAELLERFPRSRLTATDVDPRMLDAARARLGVYGKRAHVESADAASLPFDDQSFDAVVSFIMLHHVIEWEAALREAVRVLRPDGLLVGYDLVDSVPARVIHWLDRSPHRLATHASIREVLDECDIAPVAIRPSLGRMAVRFAGRKAIAATGGSG